jgi:hypothetical protein
LASHREHRVAKGLRQEQCGEELVAVYAGGFAAKRLGAAQALQCGIPVNAEGRGGGGRTSSCRQVRQECLPRRLGPLAARCQPAKLGSNQTLRGREIA